MRKILEPMVGQYVRFRATIVRYGKKAGYKGRVHSTVLCRNVVLANSGEPVTDHIWLNHGRWSNKLSKGDIIEFEARVGQYLKGYRGRNWEKLVKSPPALDYRLEDPRKVKRHASACK